VETRFAELALEQLTWFCSANLALPSVHPC